MQKPFIYYVTIFMLMLSTGVALFTLYYIQHNKPPRQIIYPTIQADKGIEKPMEIKVTPVQISTRQDLLLNNFNDSDISSLSSLLQKFKKDTLQLLQ